MSAIFAGGVPNLFTSPMAAFPARNLFHSADRPSENALGGNAFTQEDRLMIQLLYQQQQAIQIQLQSIALSMQQLHMAVVGISKPSVAMAAYGNTVNDANISTNTAACAPVAAQSSVNNTAEECMSTQHNKFNDQQGHAVMTGRPQPASAAPTTKEVSRSCTPPLEDLDASRHSAVNRSTDSAPPWDPSAGSRHSSVMRMTRAENPLLSSLRGKLPTPSRSAATSTTGGTGYTASANVSTYLDDSKPTLRPTVHPSSSSSLHHDPEVKNVVSSSLFRHTSSKSHHPRQQQQPQQRQYQGHIVLDNRKIETSHPLQKSSNASTAAPSGATTTTTTTKPTAFRQGEEMQHFNKWTSVDNHRNGGGREECGETIRSAIGYDSQSDGYGSYETRQYLKSVGII